MNKYSNHIFLGLSRRLLSVKCVLLFWASTLCMAQEVCHEPPAGSGLRAQSLENLLSAAAAIDGELSLTLRGVLDNPECASGTCSCPPEKKLDRICLLQVSINPESRVKVDQIGKSPEIVTAKWNSFLVRVQNLAGVTAPLRALSEQATDNAHGHANDRDRWLQIALPSGLALPPTLTGETVEYRIIRFRTEATGKRAAVITMDVGQGTGDIGFRSDVMLNFLCQADTSAQTSNSPEAINEKPSSDFTNSRRPENDVDMRRWLENMVVYHNFTHDEISRALGLTHAEIDQNLKKFSIKTGARKPRKADEPLVMLPYPGGRHPRIGFLEGAINPQRETKATVFAPWDNSSYVVLDVPEAIWSNLGLTYLAHTHVPTIWSKDGLELPPLEWDRGPGGSLRCERTLPNGITFGTELVPHVDSIRMKMWLKNGTTEKLSDLRVQNCVMLKGAPGFTEQTNSNKVFWGPYAACRNEAGDRWIISAWEPFGRPWGNEECPCLHSDPQFPDCEPGETQRLTGWLSFYEGTNVHEEMLRIDRTNWKLGDTRNENVRREATLLGSVLDAESGKPIPARIHIQDTDGKWHIVESDGGDAVSYVREQSHLPDSPEVHTTLSADPFRAHLPPGEYKVRVERGKEYLPLSETLFIGSEPVNRKFPLKKWINMAALGWYSGDTHVHRSIDELPNVMLAEDLNVAFPLTHWVTHAGMQPTDGKKTAESTHGAELIEVDDTHVIHPMNTEYEIFSVGKRQHTLGAVFVLGHRRPFTLGVPPVRSVATEAREQGALLDLDKHSWPWSLMLVPVMDVDLFELANNHVWQTEFGFKSWTLDSAAGFLEIERDEDGFTEWGWIDYGFQTYYALLNCGFRMRVTAGTASGVHPVQLGFGRVYVYLKDGFSYEEWIAGLDAGNSFVSTGPMLDVRFNNRHAGEQFLLAEGESPVLHVTGSAHSGRPLDFIELIVNGRVDQIIEPSNLPTSEGGFETVINETVERDGSFWVAVRCFEKNPENRPRFAHTNPVFVDVAGKPLRPRKAEVAYFIDRMHEEIERNERVLSKAALDEYRQALSIYQELAEIAR